MAMIDTARQLADGAEKARLAGDTVASLALAIKAAGTLTRRAGRVNAGAAQKIIALTCTFLLHHAQFEYI